MPWKFFSSGREKVFVNPEKNPSGMIIQYAGSSIPVGWLNCDGSQVLISSYPDLYKQIKTNYGALTDGDGGVGSTHFRLPDLRGRIPVGYQAGYDATTFVGGSRSGKGAVSGTSVSDRPIGTTAGSESTRLTSAQSGIPSHNHSIGTSGTHQHAVTGQTAHTHYYYSADTNYVDASGWTFRQTGPSGPVYSGLNFGPLEYNVKFSGIGANALSGKSGVTATNDEAAQDASSDSSGLHNNLQTSLVVNFIIKT